MLADEAAQHAARDCGDSGESRDTIDVAALRDAVALLQSETKTLQRENAALRSEIGLVQAKVRRVSCVYVYADWLALFTHFECRMLGTAAQ